METKIRSRKEDISISIRNHQTPEWGPAKNVKCGRFHSCIILGHGKGEHRLGVLLPKKYDLFWNCSLP